MRESAILIHKFVKPSVKDLGSKYLLPIQKSSPTAKVSWTGFVLDADAIYHSHIRDSILCYARATGSDG